MNTSKLLNVHKGRTLYKTISIYDILVGGKDKWVMMQNLPVYIINTTSQF